MWIRRIGLHLDIHRGTCGAGEGDRYLWWKRLETMMTSDGVVRAAQLSPGTWAFSASDDSLKGLISALLIPPHSSFHKHATCMESMHMIMSLHHNACFGWQRSQSDLLRRVMINNCPKTIRSTCLAGSSDGATSSGPRKATVFSGAL